MSELKLRTVQIGVSPTPSHNFILTTPTVPDGTLRLQRGIPGAPTQDILVIDAQGRVDGTAPSGAVMHFAASAPPAGWMKANGALVSRATYAALFAVIGTTYGAGDGTTTFKLPDLRGEFLRSWDDGRGVDAGRGIGSWQVSTSLRLMPVEWVGVDVSEGTYNFGNPYADADQIDTTTPAEPRAAGGGLLQGGYADNSMKAFADGSSAGVAANKWLRQRPRNVALLACIKF